MNDLIRFDEGSAQWVDARMLHRALQVGRDFSTWIRERVAKYGFEEDRDYRVSQSPNLGTGKNAHTGGSPAVNYLLTTAMAKELCMVENNDHGRRVRRYLIHVETAWNTPELMMARSLQFAAKKLEEARPKVEAYDHLMATGDLFTVRHVAKAIGTGEKRLFGWLRRHGYLMADESYRNQPYQRYIDQGLFDVKIATYEVNGAFHAHFRPLLTAKGAERIAREFRREHGLLDFDLGASGANT